MTPNRIRQFPNFTTCRAEIGKYEKEENGTQEFACPTSPRSAFENLSGNILLFLMPPTRLRTVNLKERVGDLPKLVPREAHWGSKKRWEAFN